MRNQLNDIRKAITHFPLLKIIENGKFLLVEGDIVLSDREYGEVDRYSVSISFLKCYPNCFPKVIETSKKIPRKDFRHVNPDGTLCLAVEPEERLISKNGITFKFFLDKVLVPHLSRETFRELNGEYADGEYDHGNAGIWEFYIKKLDNTDKKQVLLELNEIRTSKWIGRNEPCTCGSNKKFKNCHLNKWEEIKRLGDEYLKNQIENLKTDLAR
ncbi:SEC-C metal-binding domain-containing protein [Fluviicola taffensis]|uniref:SEC-C motif domain protein n=1 Tax=Fluviicola taffensis (strain DSM 16823 / NCIMB 13979 / RW262) TaxID=755732 RepID=F2IJA0_FLUTR|nr:SEC-C metal-binding domain-containing protein [Fluviicola taffensis]AEA44970.1 SEC-C motif domain protein [Fluviicola taffensis DSM 16823]